jgi:polyribonucleotide nucleotidyltransferase
MRQTNTIHEMDNIMKRLEKAEVLLMIQSDIENVLKTVLKNALSQQEKKKIKSVISSVNSRVFTEFDLIEQITKPMRLHDITIKIFHEIVLQGNPVTDKIKAEVVECYNN